MGYDAPTLTVVAGPNGAGKSTLMMAMTAAGYDFGPFVNPDVISAKLPVETPNRALRAGKRAVEEARTYIAAQRSFSQETTLTGSFAKRLMTDAKTAGYSVNLLYVGVKTLSTSRDRVAVRVARGGHDIPIVDQERRFHRSRASIEAAAQIADNAILIDNTRSDRPYRVVVDNRAGRGWLPGSASAALEPRGHLGTAASSRP